MAIAPDGTFAAYCLVWYDAANGWGIYEPEGCHHEPGNGLYESLGFTLRDWTVKWRKVVAKDEE